MQITDTFYCEKLSISGITIRACIGRQLSLSPSSNQIFMCFVDCEQGAQIKSAFPSFTIRKRKKEIVLNGCKKKAGGNCGHKQSHHYEPCER